MINNSKIANIKLNPAPENMIRNLCQNDLAQSFLFLGIFLSSSTSSPAKRTKPPIGNNRIEYSVSPPFFLKLHSFFPIPIENSYT